MKIPKSVLIKIAKGLGAVLKSPIKLLTRVFSVKTLIIIALVIVIVALLYFGIGAGLGNGAGDGEGDGNTSAVTSEEQSEQDASNAVVDSSDSTLDPGETASSNNYVQATVRGDEYWYMNERLSLDEVIDSLKENESSFVVQIKDDNASRNAYTDIIKRLDAEGIPYEEK